MGLFASVAWVASTLTALKLFLSCQMLTAFPLSDSESRKLFFPLASNHIDRTAMLFMGEELVKDMAEETLAFEINIEAEIMAATTRPIIIMQTESSSKVKAFLYDLP